MINVSQPSRDGICVYTNTVAIPSGFITLYISDIASAMPSFIILFIFYIYTPFFVTPLDVEFHFHVYVYH